MNLTQEYQQIAEKNEFYPDDCQLKALAALEDLLRQLSARSAQAGCLRRLFGARSESPAGIYLWGGVGRGKTLLMDLFFKAVPSERKQRRHFHEFMDWIHQTLKSHANESDPLSAVVDQLKQDIDLLCLDEFHVLDITDAMLLSGMLREMFLHGITLVTTSNRQPSTLYKNGLQRARFLPAIDLIEQRMTIMELDAGIDYRHLQAQKETRQDQDFNSLAQGTVAMGETLEIHHRPIPTLRLAENAVMMSFEDLCQSARATKDYRAIASQFQVIFVMDIPQMDELLEDAARRFLNFVDAVYDAGTYTVFDSDFPLEDWYRGDRLKFEFQRAVSRVTQMRRQSPPTI